MASKSAADGSLSAADITQMIIANAEVLFPREKGIKVVLGRSKTGLSHYASVVAIDQKSASLNKDYKPLIIGSAEKDRRTGMIKLLEETEFRISKEILKK